MRKSTIQMISEKYGIIKCHTRPSMKLTADFIDILKPQIKKQAICELEHEHSSPIFHYGLRWGRFAPDREYCKKFISDPININSFCPNKYYYSKYDQFGTEMVSLKTLESIINHIESYLQLSMSSYDCAIGNIYLDNMYIPAHIDNTESKYADKYPVIVYTIGNDSALGIWNDSKSNVVRNEYLSFGLNLNTSPNNEIITANGTIYAFGTNGKNRFNCIHATPINMKKNKHFPSIILPDNDFVRPELRGRIVNNYTITLTFRRAQD